MDIGHTIILVVVSLFYFIFAYQLKPPFPPHFYSMLGLKPDQTKELTKKAQNVLFRGFLFILIATMSAYSLLIFILGGF